MSYTFEDLRERCHDEWQAYTQHIFVRQLADGTLAEDAFRHYLKQDYLFLIQFSRAYALAGYKSRSLDDLRHAKAMLHAILDDEITMHIQYCRQWGISEHELQTQPEARATVAYTRYVLDTGNRGDLLDMHIALVPCVVGYGRIADWLNSRDETVRGKSNPYDDWIAMYESEAFQDAVAAEVNWLNSHLTDVSARRFDQLACIFSDASRLEIDFWDMGLNQRV